MKLRRFDLMKLETENVKYDGFVYRAARGCSRVTRALVKSLISCGYIENCVMFYVRT